MISTEYRLFFDGAPAAREALDRIDRITVEQGIDAAWQARIELTLCADAAGAWSGAAESYTAGFARIRVELRLDQGDFVALIDGPVVGQDKRLDARPGQSSLTLVVHDDSVYLNRSDGIERFENLSDSQIADRIFQQYGEIAERRVDDVPAVGGARPPEVMRRGTHMELLRELAERHHIHAYVLPGAAPGASIGVFAAAAIAPDGLPDLVLMGNGRNLEAFELRRNNQRAASVVASTISLSDKGVVTRKSNSANIELLGEEAAFDLAAGGSRRRLAPGSGDTTDLDQRVNADARRASYGFEATATVRAGCYRGVLEPYRVVTVRGIDDESNGYYLITQVTHTLDRNQYTQTLSLSRNAESSAAAAAATPGVIV